MIFFIIFYFVTNEHYNISPYMVLKPYAGPSYNHRLFRRPCTTRVIEKNDNAIVGPRSSIQTAQKRYES